MSDIIIGKCSTSIHLKRDGKTTVTKERLGALQLTLTLLPALEKVDITGELVPLNRAIQTYYCSPAVFFKETTKTLDYLQSTFQLMFC